MFFRGGRPFCRQPGCKPEAVQASLQAGGKSFRQHLPEESRLQAPEGARIGAFARHPNPGETSRKFRVRSVSPGSRIPFPFQGTSGIPACGAPQEICDTGSRFGTSSAV